MDAPGTREELRDHARRIAKHGYFCLLPDLYYRLGTLRFDIPRRNDAMSGVIRAAMHILTIANVMDDTGGMYGAIGVLTALQHRHSTGEGQHVDLSQVSAAMSLNGSALLDLTETYGSFTDAFRS